MVNGSNDILTIEQYLRGELDAHAMHLFERATLNDPFLADAVEGYSACESQLENLDVLKQRLKIRIGFDEEEKRPFNLRLLIIATIAVIGFALVAAWWILVGVPQHKKAEIPPVIQGPAVMSVVPVDTIKKDTVRKVDVSLHTLDSLRRDSAEKKKDTLNKQSQPARKADPTAGSVHPSTVIADLNRMPYALRKRMSAGQATQPSTQSLSAEKPSTDKIAVTRSLTLKPATITTAALVNTPATKVANKQAANTAKNIPGTALNSAATKPITVSPPVLKEQKPVVIESKKKPTAMQQLIQKHNETTVIIPPASDVVVSTVSVQKSAPPAQVITKVPAGIAKPDSALVAQKNLNSRKAATGGPVQPKVVNGSAGANMRGRDISSLNSEPTPVKDRFDDIPFTTSSTLKDKMNPADSAILEANRKAAAARKAKRTGPPILLQGRVVSILTGQPVAKVVMWNKTEDIQHRLEADGEFDIVAHKDDELYVGRSGYKTQKVRVKSRKRFDIILEEKNSSLYDGYIHGLNFTPFDDSAHPAIGWDKLSNYQKIKSADGKTGTVKVKFTVNRDNSLSDIKVEDSVSALADTQAVHVIRDQLKWVHNTNNQPETITVKFKVTP
ncbi:energy transducer TonB family protein [Mucilaginibacter ginkgonis]|uniref:Energy transducer TonB n=1 Tax=Mucilaginibacter ginkgonis TaxID=2682091 RepID=A0A6I4HYA2_9SPHI|nr:energy transducer TonB [Mucilaginibacter ginkgonis]QQL49564.1 energy transducer TonB [Mucilaginibacter ginkgonis]